MENPLRLTIEVDKESVVVDDSIQIRFILRNTGSTELRIVGKGVYETDWIKAYSAQMKQLPNITKIELATRWPTDEEVLVLEPGKQSVRTFTGTARKNRVKERDKFFEKSGLFLDFDHSAIALEGPGTYILKAHFASDKLWKKQAQDRLKNIWDGDIGSNAVQIVVH